MIIAPQSVETILGGRLDKARRFQFAGDEITLIQTSHLRFSKSEVGLVVRYAVKPHFQMTDLNKDQSYVLKDLWMPAPLS